MELNVEKYPNRGRRGTQGHNLITLLKKTLSYRWKALICCDSTGRGEICFLLTQWVNVSAVAFGSWWITQAQPSGVMASRLCICLLFASFVSFLLPASPLVLLRRAGMLGDPLYCRTRRVNWTIVAHLFPIMSCYLRGFIKGDVVHRTCTVYSDRPFALQVSEAAYQCLHRGKGLTRICVLL